jgi:hypothetical protein
MSVYTSADEIVAELKARLAQITKANGFETDIGVTTFEGRVQVNDEDVPCSSIIEGDDTLITSPGRSALWKLDQNYVLVGYAQCDADNPGTTARAIIRDLKRAVFRSNGKADATFGGKVLEVNYRGRNIGPRADGVGIVMGLIEIAVVYVESLP